MLTGRDEEMETLRTFGGLAGFPKPLESPHDAFIAGHASNAVSIALGMALARTRTGGNYHVAALLGDGALTGGLSYEGLSNAGQSGDPLLVILNDNGMSITKNVGGVARHLARQRLRPQYLRVKKVYRKIMWATPPGRGFYRFTHKLKSAVKAALLPASFFEDMGFRYMGPVDGHDVAELTRLLRQAKGDTQPVLLHIRTIKGRGYAPAEENPDAFHGVSPFHRADGTPLAPKSAPCFSDVCGETLLELAGEEPRLCTLTAAMETGTGLAEFARAYPGRFFDVGIAEGHAVSMAAGMAKQGLLPVFAVYSTFLQRSYDMLLHDVAISRLHVILCVDRAGLVGEDGETHHGLFDLAFLQTIPGMTIFAPGNFAELQSMLKQAVRQVGGPVALRYPRGGEGRYTENPDSGENPCVCPRCGADVTIVTYGTLINQCLDAADILAEGGISAEVLKLGRVAPLDTARIAESVSKTGRLLVAEEVVSLGCVGERVLAALAVRNVVPGVSALCNCGDGFVTHGTVPELRKLCRIDADSIAAKARDLCREGARFHGE
jgi:1-deoxy-D-xylulose-5-phosphate synthase